MPNCRFCNAELKTLMADLNMAPIANNYINLANRNCAEPYYPLKVYVCENCLLVQTEDFNASTELFTDDYPYFSSFSSSWLNHSKNYVEMICEKLKLDSNSFVMEIASNDGYLLQYFQEKNIDLLGIEPCKSVADVAISKGINTITEFFTAELGRKIQKADLICMCNVLAHVPDINDFVLGIKLALKESGTVTIEFPHLYNLIKYNQFDTIYQEHYSYLSLLFVKKLFEAHGLNIYDVEEIQTHGGSLRIYACHESYGKDVSENVSKVLHKECSLGLNNLVIYQEFHDKIKSTKRDLLKLLISIKNSGQSIVAYGAAAKGNTLFNYCGISTDFIDYCVDLNVNKQNKLLPGSHIEVFSPEKISETKPDYILITPWNIKNEIMEQLSYTKEWGCKFIVAIPKPEILS